jgi:hypothetical protein
MRTTRLLLLPLLLFGGLAAAPGEKLVSPQGRPEYGHGVSADDALAGWVSLFDGKTAFGWADGAKVKDGTLAGEAATTTRFGDVELRADVEGDGTLTVGAGRAIAVKAGRLEATVERAGTGPIRLGPGLAVKAIAVRPLKLKDVTPGEDLAGWSVVRRQGEEPRTRWTVKDGVLRAAGGPGALELQDQYGDLVLQATVTTRRPTANGGIFFRCIPGDFMNGYEAQIYNAAAGGDPSKPAEYSTGAIDDRQGARRVVSRDGEPFTMTVVADGPHVATWVNGYAMTDWTDTRDEHDNPRQGLRREPGTVQLQSHDPDTDIEFRDIRVGALE